MMNLDKYAERRMRRWGTSSPADVDTRRWMHASPQVGLAEGGGRGVRT